MTRTLLERKTQVGARRRGSTQLRVFIAYNLLKKTVALAITWRTVVEFWKERLKPGSIFLQKYVPLD